MLFSFWSINLKGCYINVSHTKPYNLTHILQWQSTVGLRLFFRKHRSHRKPPRKDFRRKDYAILRLLYSRSKKKKSQPHPNWTYRYRNYSRSHRRHNISGLVSGKRHLIWFSTLHCIIMTSELCFTNLCNVLCAWLSLTDLEHLPVYSKCTRILSSCPCRCRTCCCGQSKYGHWTSSPWVRRHRTWCQRPCLY